MFLNTSGNNCELDEINSSPQTENKKLSATIINKFIV